MLPSGSKSSDHGNSSQHAEVCVGVSSFHVWVISTCAAFFVSICLSHTVVWVCECFYLLLMFVCSMQPSNIFWKDRIVPTNIWATFIILSLVWNHIRLFQISPWQRKTINQCTSAGFHSEVAFFTNESMLLGVLVCLVLASSFFTSSLQKYSFMLRLSVVIISIFCLRNHVFTSVWNGKRL